MRTTTLLFAVVLAASARPALAQGIDVGVGVSQTQTVYDGDNYKSAGPTVAFHFTDKHAVQILTDINLRRWAYEDIRYSDVRGIYFVQYRYTFGAPARRVRLSLAAGTAGGVERHHTSAFTYTEYGGHYDQGRWVQTPPVRKDAPARTHTAVAPPIVPAFGIGVDANLNRRVAIRSEFSIGVGPYFLAAGRAAAGLVVHLGSR